MSPKYLDHVHSDTRYQSDIDHAFGDMFSTLEECKQVMKDEVNEHYQSLAVTFKSKKQLKKLSTRIGTVGELCTNVTG